MAEEILHKGFDFQNINRIRNLPTPSNPDEPARLSDLSTAIEGLASKDNVRVATQSNINLASPGSTIDGVVMTDGDPNNRVLVRNQTAPDENGICIWNGAAVAMTRAPDASTAVEMENAVVSVDEGTDAGTTWRQTSVNFTLGSGAVSWIPFGTAVPSASETTAGKAEIATQAETDTGTDDLRIVTPAKLANAANRKRKFASDIGDGSATQYDVTHNFGTRDLQVIVRRNSGSYDQVGALVGFPDTNTVRITMTPAPTSNAFRVTILG